MIRPSLPPRDEMMEAFLSRDASYEGVFVTAVRTTGVFCRPSCPARKPRLENVEFHPSARDALLAGFRPCSRCRPMEPAGTAPAWIGSLLREMEAAPARRWRDSDLRRLGLNPDRVRRWFQEHHQMTFHAYHRARRLGLALGRIRQGAPVTPAAFDHGYESLSGFNDAFRRLLGSPPGRARGSVTTVTLNRIPTPLGPMLAGATPDGLCLLEFADRRMLETQLQRLQKRLGAAFVPGTNAILDHLAEELGRYFASELREFSVPLSTPGTEFQRAIWGRLRWVPYGTTTTYGALARSLGRADATRAVARANGDNRIAILIPCHRVVGSDGRLTGYGGGLWRKQRLLEHEGVELYSGISSGDGKEVRADAEQRRLALDPPQGYEQGLVREGPLVLGRE
jgi:AraC family transcriptional regulator of adaptative response/methylated-DNA-[protein]-cysteine methyltransferase